MKRRLNLSAPTSKKGDPVYAEARVANSTYERNDQKVYSTDLIVSLLNRFDPAENKFTV
jgi:single-stranded DNA-binding protein